MKQLLFLLLFPCLALAQYTGNGNQKITLGEQTTADGLVYRGVENDTALITPFSDTSAYIILDTINNKFYNYNRSTNVWSLAGGGGGSTLDTATMLLPYYRAGKNGIIQAADVPTLNQNTTGSAATLTTGRTIQTNLASTSAATFNGSANITPGVTGVLPLANGGTGQSTLAAAGINTGSGTLNYLPKYTVTGTTLGNSIIFDNGSNVGIGTNTPGAAIHVAGAISSIPTGGGFFAGIQSNYAVIHLNGNEATGSLIDFSVSGTDTKGRILYDNTNNYFIFNTDGTERMRITNAGNVGIGTASPQSGYQLHIVDSVYVGGRVSAAGYTTRSDYDLKDEIQSLNYGLNEVIQMQPVKYTYKSNGEQQLGFIAQDIGTLIPESVHFDSFMGVDYQSIIPILTKAIQQQQAQIEALKQRILILENK